MNPVSCSQAEHPDHPAHCREDQLGTGPLLFQCALGEDAAAQGAREGVGDWAGFPLLPPPRAALPTCAILPGRQPILVGMLCRVCLETEKEVMFVLRLC